MKTEKGIYQKPLIEVIVVENEGSVMALSDVTHGGNIYQSTATKGTSRTGTKYQSQSPMQELEDMINDFLTY